MAFRRFRKSHRYVDGNGRRVVIPRAWSGDLPDQVAKDADAAGATFAPPRAEEPAAVTRQAAPAAPAPVDPAPIEEPAPIAEPAPIDAPPAPAPAPAAPKPRGRPRK